jgi:SAM-dependent methyltransferase
MRYLLEPFALIGRKFFDPRIAVLNQEIQAKIDSSANHVEYRLSELSSAEAAAIRDQNSVLRSHVRSLEDYTRALDERIDSLASDMDSRYGTANIHLETIDARLDDVTKIQTSVQRELVGIRKYTDHWLSFSYPEETEGISTGLAEALNFSSGHRGYAAQSSLWFNPALSLRYSEGAVELYSVNERIAETAFVLAEAIERTPPGGRILDLGCGESLIAYELASFGFDVVGIDLNKYPLTHPNLTTVASPLEGIEDDKLRDFDTIVCLSAIEHFGLGAYGEDADEGRADIEALSRLAELSSPDTSLILTTPFGKPSVTEFQRVYDEEGLEELLSSWDVDERQFANQSDGSWTVESEATISSDSHGVALVVAQSHT